MRFISGMVAGMVVGSAISAVSVSNMDRKTRKKIGKTGRVLSSVKDDIYSSVNSMKG